MKSCKNCKYWVSRNKDKVFGICKNDDPFSCDFINITDSCVFTLDPTKFLVGRNFGCIHFIGNEIFRNHQRHVENQEPEEQNDYDERQEV